MIVLRRRRRDPVLREGVKRQVEARRDAALGVVGSSTAAAARVRGAPPAYLVAHAPADIARHAEMLATVPAVGHVRVVVTPTDARGRWHLDVGARDRLGLLASVTGVLSDMGIDVVQAVLATWQDGAALQAFVVRAAAEPEPAALQDALRAPRPLLADPVPDAEVRFDPEAGGLYTCCDVRARDRAGLLHAVAVAITVAGVDVHAARIATAEGVADDRFDLADRAGRPLASGMDQVIQELLRRGAGE